MTLDVVMRIITANANIPAEVFGGAGFSLWGLVLARSKPHRLKPAPLRYPFGSEKRGLNDTETPYAAM
jgi:hypothetical protein